VVLVAHGGRTNSHIFQSSPQARSKTPVIIPHTERDISRSAATARSPTQQPQRTQLVGEERQKPQRTQLVGEEGPGWGTLQRTRRNVTRFAAPPPGEEGQQPQRTQLDGEEGPGEGTLQRTRRNVTRSAAPPPARENLLMQPPRSLTELAGEEGLAGESILPRAADYLNQEGWSLVTSPEAFSSGPILPTIFPTIRCSRVGKIVGALFCSIVVRSKPGRGSIGHRCGRE
jgi:hypothetical protein